MQQKKLVKKSLPCSFYDIQGIHSWLDEMALQGLFLHHLNDTSDRAYFQRGESQPVRYRLDPIGKNWNDLERKENYAQMGWEFVDAIPTHFYIFSCDDPTAPELYSDPETMGFALSRLVRRKARWSILGVLLILFSTGLLLCLAWESIVRNLILREHPFLLLYYGFFLILMAAALIALGLELRQTWTVCRTLEQGLTQKAGRRRRWRPTFLMGYLCIYIPLSFLPLLGRELTTVQTCDSAALSRPWRAVAQQVLEDPSAPAAGYLGYAEHNTRPPDTAPVQEYLFLSEAKTGGPCISVRYVQTRSSKLAQQVFQILRDDAGQELERYKNNSYGSRVFALTPFAPQDWPELDQLETASFQRYGLDGFAFAALRGQDVLVVECIGRARWEDCLPLFLETLNQPLAEEGV